MDERDAPYEGYERTVEDDKELLDFIAENNLQLDEGSRLYKVAKSINHPCLTMQDRGKMSSINDLVEGITQATEYEKGYGNAKETNREGTFLDISKIPLYEYIKLKDYLSDDDVDRVKRWNEWPKQERMVELYYEVEKLSQYKGEEKALIMQLAVISDISKIIRNCSDVSEEEYIEIKTAEWRVYDYYIGKNTFHIENEYETIECYKEWYRDFSTNL